MIEMAISPLRRRMIEDMTVRSRPERWHPESLLPGRRVAGQSGCGETRRSSLGNGGRGFPRGRDASREPPNAPATRTADGGWRACAQAALFPAPRRRSRGRWATLASTISDCRASRPLPGLTQTIKLYRRPSGNGRRRSAEKCSSLARTVASPATPPHPGRAPAPCRRRRIRLSPAARIDVQHVSRAVLLDEELQRSGLDRQIGACHL